jgi:hypothetical protein
MSEALDFNDDDYAGSDGFEAIPDGTIVPLIMRLERKEDGSIMHKNKNDYDMLKAVYTVTDGPYKNRKIWDTINLDGEKLNPKTGKSWSAQFAGQRFRRILESARDVDPSAMDPNSINARKLPGGYEDLDELQFLGKLEFVPAKPKDPNFPDGEKWDPQNKLKSVCTKDTAAYKTFTSGSYVPPAPAPEREPVGTQVENAIGSGSTVAGTVPAPDNAPPAWLANAQS